MKLIYHCSYTLLIINILLLSSCTKVKYGPVELPNSDNMFHIIFFQDFENNTTGDYLESEWEEDWNDPLWANHANGFGIISEEDNSNKYLKIEFPPGSFLLDNSGIQWLTSLDSTYNELYLSYKLKFSQGFTNIDLHGKLPGLSGGTSVAGGELPDGTDGWSGRYMFHGTYLRFYLYHPDLYLKYGDPEPVPDKEYHGESVMFGTGIIIEPEKWYIITQRIVMNNVGMHDGLVEGYINNKMLAQKTGIRFRDMEQLAIDKIFMASFFGGSGSPPAEPENICFDDFCVYLYKENIDVPRGNDPSPPNRNLILPDKISR